MRKRTQLLAVLAVPLMVASACAGGGGAGGDEPAGPPQPGGSITVLEDQAFTGGWPSGLDPATNTTGGANISQMHAIYGGLFLLRAKDDGSDAEVVPHQAESYELLDDGATLKLTIREGIEFSDGTPMDAEAVAWNFKRSVQSTCTCAPPWPLVEKNAITTEGDRTVVVRFTQPYGAVISSFPITNANWMASPTAVDKIGEEKFKITPVGAGPFTVVSNKLSSELVLKKNPNYFKKNRPYLDGLTFKSVGGDQPAYQALLAGQGDAYEGLSNTQLLKQAQGNQQLKVTVQPATSPYVIQLNTRKAPFNNQKAREAIYYATDFNAISKGLFDGQYPPVQTFTGPGGLFHEPKIEGYRTFDLERAKQLVNELGGIEIKLGTLGAYVADQVMTALQTQWQKAGIKVTVERLELNRLVQAFNSQDWQAMLQTAGAWDPASGVGVGFRFQSDSPFTGVSDPKLDELLLNAAGTVDEAERAKLYADAGKLISDKAYAPFGIAFAPANLAVDGVHGPGLTTKLPPMVVNSSVIWEDVWTSNP